ncbi:MAG: bifunctional adenosylcobinamide kinase/adenosylcobinamide-phosphate guanylyltransferase [Deltaproteobacteria bacterium RIFCSPLOWO2_02_FULL_53_8]|nr:MAG: bifunctional adenosylcobinamide kinase/adenosylcobinamide-phosphate guanylyltransferase [Deltaproteobacteria bacterium RIFCSPLOWO2_02_FULL_53_8]
MEETENRRRFALVLGGARCGKSGFAQRLAEQSQPPWVYLATAQPLDIEMTERIAAHRLSRDGRWATVEDPLTPGQRIMEIDDGVALIDCVTLWITNLLCAGRLDAEILADVDGLALASSGSRASVIIVSNEVGAGIVPENGLARRFRDLAGTANQRLAAAADDVWLVTAGIPLKLK